MPAESDPTHLLERLLSKDTTLWSEDDEVACKILQRLGWLDTIRWSKNHVSRLADFSGQVEADGFDRVILLGMGGSSLAPEVFQRCFSTTTDGIGFSVLDTTFPDSVALATDEAARGKPLFIVSSKSGTTTETLSLQEHFWHWCQSRYADAAPGHFVAITDEDSALHRLANQRGYRDTFINPTDIGGRYSALSLFGLVPASLLDIDLNLLLERASDLLGTPSQASSAIELGLLIGNAALAGRDKLTLHFSPELEPLGTWVEQLVCESTGKNGTGILSVVHEPDLPPDRYGADRIFVATCLKTDSGCIEAWQDRLRELAGKRHPGCLLEVGSIYDLGAEFMRWQVATSIAASVVGVNPFDEPDVNATKDATRQILLLGPHSDDNETTAAAPAADDFTRFLDPVRAPDYIALLAYLPCTTRWTNTLRRMRDRIAASSDAAVVLSFGPRYLHSSGQLHKGGKENGHFLVLTATGNRDVLIPGQEYGFQHLINAQALADIQVLQDRGQKVMHIHLGAVDEAHELVTELMVSLPGPPDGPQPPTS